MAEFEAFDWLCPSYPTGLSEAEEEDRAWEAVTGTAGSTTGSEREEIILIEW